MVLLGGLILLFWRPGFFELNRQKEVSNKNFLNNSAKRRKYIFSSLLFSMDIFCLDYYSVLIVATRKQFGEPRQA